MKKITFIFAALFVATFTNAQITLEKSFNRLILSADVQILQGKDVSGGRVDRTIFPKFLGQYLVDQIEGSYYEESQSIYDIYDPQTLTLIKTFNTANMIPADAYIFGLISRGIFTTDNRWAWAYTKMNSSTNVSELFIVTEDKTELLHVYYDSGYDLSFYTYPYIIKTGDRYKLVVPSVSVGEEMRTNVYSLPGNGNSGQGIESSSSPRKSSARKYLRNDQVLVENADHTYTLTGQEVK